ncbi:ThuA domain-containing protein [Aurantibacter sp.]|uniref:ThuA domain-containing protein n=1 Tax=Aurantibacter sp. TaxID=2807103 RepID=UPI003262D5AE
MKNVLLKYAMALAIICMCQRVTAQETPLLPEIPVQKDTIVEPVGPDVLSFILVNADTDTDIDVIIEGSVFNLEEIGTRNLNIRAEVDSLTESVVFDYQLVKNYHTENLPVYAIGINDDEDYRPWKPDLGSNILTATAFNEDKGEGISGQPLTVNFEIVEGEIVETQPSFQLRINSGGEAVVINDSIQFVADTLFVGNSKPYANYNIVDVLNTTNDSIYKSERTSNGSPRTFGYAVPVNNGEYDINLHFAEIYWGATKGGVAGVGKRVFNVTIEGEEVLVDFDLGVEAEPMSAIVKAFKTEVVDGELNIELNASVDQPKISALEIFGEVHKDIEECIWNDLASTLHETTNAQSIKVNDKLYILSSVISDSIVSSVTEVYDADTNIWSSAKPMPLVVSDMGAVVVEDEIWLVGGVQNDSLSNFTAEVQVYNTVTDTWSVGPALPSPRATGAVTYNKGQVHYIGGLMADGVTRLNEHLVLDINDKGAGWIAAAALPDSRNHLSAAAVNGKIYAIGGQISDTLTVNFMDEYDPVLNSWSQKSNLLNVRSHFGSGTIVHNNKIIVVGGKSDTFNIDDISEYDIESDTWVERCDLPSAMGAPAAKVIGDKLIVVNGKTTISMEIEPEVIVEEAHEIRVLIYHETGEFRHSSIQAGIAMINEFGDELDWVVADSQTSDVFTSDNLENYDVVLWLNTTGDDILSKDEESAFESFIQNGGGYVGVHSATDTYRSGTWSWYNELVGAIVQVSPYHTSSNFNGVIDVVGDHDATAHLDTEWVKNDEYYYWELNGGYLYDGNIDLLQVRTTGTNSYDATRPVTWYKEYDGGRSFYTALGHHARDFESDVSFRTMIKEAIIWAARDNETAIIEVEEEEEETDLADTATENTIFKLYPNPVIDLLSVDVSAFTGIKEGVIYIFGMDGNIVGYKKINSADNQINLSELPTGYYIASVKVGTTSERHLIYKQ